MLLKRIIFGCGRLTGGPSFAEAADILATCTDYGVTHFDAAPSYGIGTAEDVLGRVFGGRTDISITTKVGSRRPRFRVALAYVRTAKRRLGLSKSDNRLGYDPLSPQRLQEWSSSGPCALRRSLADSLVRLRRTDVDRLLLHEIAPEDVSAELIRFLSDQRGRGITRVVGYSSSLSYKPSVLPQGLVAQTALPVELLLGRAATLDRSVTFHSVLRVVNWLRTADPEFARALDETTTVFASEFPSGDAEAVVAYALASEAAPDANLIYATTARGRLRSFLVGLKTVDERQFGPAITEAFLLRLGGRRCWQERRRSPPYGRHTLSNQRVPPIRIKS